MEEVPMGKGRQKAGDQVEDKVLDMAQMVLDVIAENPEVGHIASEVEKPAVHEHGG